MIKDIKKWIIIALSFAGTLWLIWVVYWAWVNINTVSNWQTLDATLINNIINNQNDLNTRVSWLSIIPTWFVWAFNLSSCPTWWTAADWNNSTPDLRWAFVRGMNWNINWRDVARTLWDYKVDTLKAHSHSLPYGPNVGGSSYALNALYNALSTTSWYIWATWTFWDTETSPKNVVLLYCQKL